METSRGGKLTETETQTGHEHLLDDLDDVSTAGMDVGDVLTFNGVGWVAASPATVNDAPGPSAVMPVWEEEVFVVGPADLTPGFDWVVTLAYEPHAHSMFVFLNGLVLRPTEYAVSGFDLTVYEEVFAGLDAGSWYVMIRFTRDPSAPSQVPDVVGWALNGAAAAGDGEVVLTPAAAGVSGLAVCPTLFENPLSVTVSGVIDGDSTAGGWSIALLDAEDQGAGYLGVDYGVVSVYVGWDAVILSDGEGLVWSQNLVTTMAGEPWSSSGLPHDVSVTWTRTDVNLASISVIMDVTTVFETPIEWMPTNVLVAIGAWNDPDTLTPARHTVSDVSVSTT